ncbi:SRPBCC family protein [Actinoallomurus rhizosphaericola]|uniref:SRPBCC family protein n=1 Tax=Actinoallomurus rhizosphaericola TaxID=2952536 RepID=UPI002092A362|nr:SRPBCC family protein [Actinoallomurus rhizosphaericola]MCO5996357.1 SRPBCC family protein [Actinoallomurus rhizosphaericola]
MPYSYSVTSHSPANPDIVFAALVRAATWPSWSPIDAAEIEGGGDPAGRQRVGDTRIFRTGRAVSRERIVELVADRRFGYENVSGPFRSYRGTVELAAAPQGGTDITWSATFEPKLRLSGPFWRWYLTRFMQRMVDGLASYADDQS